MRSSLLIIPLILLFLPLEVLARVPDAADGSPVPDSASRRSFGEVWRDVNTRMQENKARKIEEGRVIISPAIMPGYNPELKFMLTGGGIVSWTNNKKNKELPRSNMAVGFAMSTTGGMVINLRPVTFWADDRFRFNAGFWYKYMPDNYWGIGYQHGFETPESDTTTAFQRRWLQIKTEALFRIRGDLFAGPAFDVNYTRGSEESAGVLADPNYMIYNERPLNTGIGAVIRFDSRDITVNAWKGLYLNIEYLFYSPVLGGDNKYQVALLDYRQYHRIRHRDGNVLTWHLYSRVSFGEVPYGEMSQLGNPFGLRGYTWGQYRDKSMTYGLVEYRHTFRKPDGSLRRHGMVAWVGAGGIYDLEENDFGGNRTSGNKLLPNAGIGYRLEVQPRLNMRLDFGVGRQTTGFYFNVVEAF
jgi:hypothetical protein